MQPILNSLSNDKFDYLATNGGQLQPSGSMIDPEERGKTAGRALAIVSILDDVSNYQLPAGSTAQVATYTEYWHHFAIIRRILLRMKSWLNYVFTEGH